MTITSKIAEKIVFDYFNTLGKNTMVTRFIDSADINRLSYKSGTRFTAVNVSQPSDLLITSQGFTSYVEVKSTENVKGLTKSLFKQQVGSRKRVIAAGGNYLYFIYSIAQKTWYQIPALLLKENAKWCELEKYKIDYLRKV